VITNAFETFTLVVVLSHHFVRPLFLQPVEKVPEWSSGRKKHAVGLACCLRPARQVGAPQISLRAVDLAVVV